MQDLARLGFVLLGVDIAVSPLASLFVWFRPIGSQPESGYLQPLLISVAGWAVFGLAPGAFLLVRNRRLASSLFPEATREPLDTRSIFAALVACLGVYLVIAGLGSLVISVVSIGFLVSSGPEFWAKFAGGAASAVLQAGFGCLLALRAAAVARFVWRWPSL